ncbi:MAG: hypothetical protein WD267_03235 [Balneolales bacterium]
MDLISTEELRELVESRDDKALSLFMPSHKTGSGMMQDPIRLKNLLKEADDTLREQGIRDTNKFLEPLQSKLRDQDFWQHMSDGLAVFRSNGITKFYRVPVNFEELVSVNDRFHVKPLLPLFSVNGLFHILGLSQNKLRLFRGTRHTVTEMEVPDAPQSLDEFLKLDEFEKSQQFHSQTGTPAPGEGTRAAIWHGHEGHVDENDQIIRWFREVDKVISPTLKGEPLVLYGVEKLHPLYKKANSYDALVNKGVKGNPEILNPKEIHDKAWDVMEPHFLQSQKEDAGRFDELSGTGKTASTVEEAMPAAAHGRMRVLFVALNSHAWGRYNSETAEVIRMERGEKGADDLLDLISVYTVLNSGVVHVVNEDQIPGGGELAGVFRY